MAAPALMNMQIPNLLANSPNPQAQGLAILQAALKQQQPNLTTPTNPNAPMSLAPPASSPGMGLLSKLFPNMSGASGAAPIDPNSGLPVTPDVMAGAAAMGGPPAPSPTALTGLW